MSSFNEDNDNKEGKTKEVVAVDKKHIYVMKKIEKSCNEDAQKIVADAEGKVSNSVARGEAMQPQLLNFLMDLANMTIIGDIKRQYDQYVKLEEPKPFKEKNEATQTHFNEKNDMSQIKKNLVT